MDPHLPLIEPTTAEALAKTVGVAYDPWMQDWPLEVADADRIEEFLSHHGREVNSKHRIAIAVLIGASLDDAFALGTPPPQLLDRAGPILKNYPELVEYWSCPDAHTADEMFHITPWIRSL
jgi:hypothetical protein